MPATPLKRAPSPPLMLWTQTTEHPLHVNNSYTDIYTSRDILLLVRIICIANAITPLLEKADFKDYGITAARLDSLTKKAHQFNSEIGLGKTINRHSQYASQNITAILKKIRASIKQLQRLIILFKETHPAFITGFQQALIAEQTTDLATV